MYFLEKRCRILLFFSAKIRNFCMLYYFNPFLKNLGYVIFFIMEDRLNSLNLSTKIFSYMNRYEMKDPYIT